MAGSHCIDSNQTSTLPHCPQGVEEVKRSVVAAACDGGSPFRFNGMVGAQRAQLQSHHNFVELEER
jgi:hypothetical protein